MNVAALSTNLSTIQLKQSVGVALTKKVMDVSQTQSNGLLRMMDASIPTSHPTSGHLIDLKG